MGKKAKPRKLKATQAQAVTRLIKTGPQKMNLVCKLIRNKPVAQALEILSFSTRRVAGDVKKTLQSAIANAENNHQLDVDNLFVSEAFVGKAITLKRFSPRSQGRAFKIMKPFSRLTVIVEERAPVEKPAKAEKTADGTKKPKAKKTTEAKKEAA
jgi:large subunit ribosomal protein L22